MSYARVVDGPKPRKHFHNLTIKEQAAESRRRLAERFPNRVYRCRYCRTGVDAATRAGHLGRCAPARAAGVVVTPADDLEGHFDEAAR